MTRLIINTLTNTFIKNFNLLIYHDLIIDKGVAPFNSCKSMQCGVSLFKQIPTSKQIKEFNFKYALL